MPPTRHAAQLPALDPALAAAINQVRSRYGDAALMRMKERAITAVDVIPTGFASLDRALGLPGWPKGRIVEIYGPESAGKTTLALHAVAETQAMGGCAAYVDVEHAFDVKYAARLGVIPSELLLSQPDSGDEALEIVDRLVCSHAVDLIVVDSVAALVPKAELEADMGAQLPGLQARLMSQALRKLVGHAHQSGTMILFINQLRHKIGVMFGNPETTTGGQALKFYATVRIDVRRGDAIKDAAGKTVGHRARVKVAKNKLAPPFRETTIPMRHGEGLDAVADLVDLGLELGVIGRMGSRVMLGGECLGAGHAAAVTLLRADTALRGRVLSAVRAAP